MARPHPAPRDREERPGWLFNELLVQGQMIGQSQERPAFWASALNIRGKSQVRSLQRIAARSQPSRYLTFKHCTSSRNMEQFT
jgi:hypothetical protein